MITDNDTLYMYIAISVYFGVYSIFRYISGNGRVPEFDYTGNEELERLKAVN